jgi:hypothetical protein
MDRCPCVSARHGAFVLALCAYAAIRSQAFFGYSAMFIANAARNGNAAAFVVAGLWLALTLLGLCWAVAGYRATLDHVDPVNSASVLYSVGVIALCWWLLQSVLSPAVDVLIEIGRAFAVAWIAGNAVNLWLQLRGLIPGTLPLRQPQPAPVSGIVPPAVRALQTLAARQSAEIDRLTAERNQLAHELEHRPVPALVEVEAVLKFPGVPRAVLAALHPDRARTDSDRAAQTKRFQTASALFERIGAR